MNKTVSEYIKSCEMPALLDLFDAIIEEINKRKARESSGGVNDYLQSHELEERQSLYRRNASIVDPPKKSTF